MVLTNKTDNSAKKNNGRKERVYIIMSKSNESMI